MRLVVGRITKPHGIRGEVVVEVRTDEPAVRFAAGSVLSTDPAASASSGASAAPVPREVTVVAARPHHDRYILVLDGIGDRTAAESLRGVMLCVDRSEVVVSGDPDEFSDHDLIGLVAVDRGGERLGEIVRIDHAPASDLLVLRRPSGKTSLVPFVRAIVPEVDVAAGRLVLTPPEGLLDL
ncbi:MAG: ribosome maturation factor RimM [Micromonosporaceae bacterium]|nr:ribosome maturation factor RimM [Micromonosporaceae bacterium]